ncbi:MAG: hypothetical protein HY525_11020 [Betaproteobacteria bacterium]|nr:hypothetical protein [Betaproteobacteria bacterium]
MITRRRAVLFVRVPAVPAEIDAEWNAWYDEIHIAYRMDKPHFLGARRYHALAGEPRCFVLYELACVDALTSPQYLEHRRWETAQPAGTFESIGPKLPGFERGVYEQTYGPQWPCKSFETSTIFLAGHDPLPADEDAFNTWYDTEHARAIERMPGVTALRRFKLTQTPLTARSGVRTARPEYLAAYYLTFEAVAEGETFRQEIETTWRKGQGGVAPRFAMLGRLIYSVAAKGPKNGPDSHGTTLSPSHASAKRFR